MTKTNLKAWSNHSLSYLSFRIKSEVLFCLYRRLLYLWCANALVKNRIADPGGVGPDPDLTLKKNWTLKFWINGEDVGMKNSENL